MSLRREIVSFGPTLARPMGWNDAMAVMGAVCDANQYSALVVTLSHSRDPMVQNVDCAIDDNITPQAASSALLTASRQIAKLYGDGGEPVVVKDVDRVEALRRLAEDLVDFARSCRVSRPDGLLVRSFDHPRQHCVDEVLAALLVARVDDQMRLSDVAPIADARVAEADTVEAVKEPEVVTS